MGPRERRGLSVHETPRQISEGSTRGTTTVQQQLSKFLLSYRQTSHSVTKVPPAQLLFNRNIQGKRPTIKSKLIVNRHKEAKQNQEQRRHKAKQYADARRPARSSDINVGDLVLVKQEKHNKLSTNFSLHPHKAKEFKGSKIDVERNGHIITRNSSFFRKVPEALAKDEEDEGMEILGPRNEVVLAATAGRCTAATAGRCTVDGQEIARNGKRTEHYGEVILILLIYHKL